MRTMFFLIILNFLALAQFPSFRGVNGTDVGKAVILSNSATSQDLVANLTMADVNFGAVDLNEFVVNSRIHSTANRSSRGSSASTSRSEERPNSGGASSAPSKEPKPHERAGNQGWLVTALVLVVVISGMVVLGTLYSRSSAKRSSGR